MLFQECKKLYDNQLYANVLPIGSILLSMYETDRSSSTPENHFRMLMYYGISLSEERQYRRAENMFLKALTARKTLPANSSIANDFNEVDITLRLALVLEQIQEIPEALTYLQSIPEQHRTAKVNMLLAKYLQYDGYDKAAIEPLKAVLRECPLNLEAIQNLVALGVKQCELNTLMVEAGVSSQCTEWLGAYIAAQCYMFYSRYEEAVGELEAIISKPGVGDSECILVSIGKCYHYEGNYDMAMYYLRKAYDKDIYMVDGLMTLSTVYTIKDRADDLEKLTIPTRGAGEFTSEYWFVMGQHLFMQGKHEKALCFADKSCHLKPKNSEAAAEGNLLKVKLYMHMKKYKEAIMYLRMLQQFAPHRFEVYEGLVEVYLVTNRPREAQEISKIGVRRFGPNISSRSFVLLARPYFVHVSQRMKAKAILERALTKDQYYLPAVLLMVTLLQDENDTSAAVKLIKKQLKVQPSSKLYSLLGDIVCGEKDHAKAVEYYTSAITMDPTNRKAVAGLIGLGQSSSKNDASTSGTATYPNATTSTDDEGVLFGTVVTTNHDAPETISDSEALWSDLEIDEQMVEGR